ncbi:hypothetical protein DHX103_03005 [Planococcus sp. X10-3]|uniref:hypothetical protein n=1 Tax=Planococcus sp. X10-3 TaxID=3061240 RepID=UPI003BB0E10D
MKYHQYKGVVEREYKMSLKKIMHQICIIEDMNAVEGAKKLGIAREVFVYWQRYFRLEKRQLLFDQTVQELIDLETLYLEDPKRKEIPSIPESSESLDELEDVVSGLIEYYKYIHYTSDGLSLKTAKLPLYEFSKSVISDFKKGSLTEELQPES